MDSIQLGQALRALRRQRGWTQAQVGSKAGVSQAAVSRAERGAAFALTGRTLVRIAEALGARYQPRLLFRGEALDRLLDAAHAGLVDQVIEILVRHGWQVVPEATFSRFGERGSVDVLAFHPATGALLVVEVKSVVPDMQALLAGVNRKSRLAPVIARELHWTVRSVSRLIVLPDDRTARRRLVEHAATLDVAFPLRTRAVRRWLAEPESAIGGILVLPASPSTTARHRVPARPRSPTGRRTAGGASQSQAA